MGLAAFSAALDNNVLNVCLPILAGEFNTDIGKVQFVSSAYVFTICSLLLFFAYISSAAGRKYVFSAGVGLFAAGSLAAAFSTSVPGLIIFRIVQGIGAAMFMANGMALIHSHFSDSVKGRAFGVMFTATAVASIIGPVAGGMIATYWGWRTIFLLMVPLGVISALLALVLLQKENKDSIKFFDGKGTTSCISFVLLFFVSFLYLQKGDIKLFILSILGSLVMLYLFVRVQKKARNPIVNIEVFSQKVIMRANIQAGIIFSIMIGVGVVLPVYIHDTLKYPPSYSGIVLASMAGSIFALSYIGGYLADKVGTHRIVSIGTLLVFTGMLVLGCAIYFGMEGTLYIGNILLGAGIGFFNPANNKIVMVSVPMELSATAASINVLSRNAGIAIGTTVAGLCYALLMKMGCGTIMSAFYSLSLFIILSVIVLITDTLNSTGLRSVKRQIQV
jgi:MFS family permease